MREKEQREKEQREKEREREERERHFAAAQMYAAEMQRNLFLSGFHAASQRSPLGLGLGFPPGVPGLPPHMAGHPFSHISAMAGVAGIPGLSHTSSIPTSYNASSSSLNLSQSRNHVSPVGGGGGGENAAAPAHSSNIPTLPKHYLPSHKTDLSKQKHPVVSMPLTSIASAHDASMYMSSERHANSSSNRNSSNHNSANSHLNVDQHHSKSIPKSMYAMQRDHRTTPRVSSAASYTGTDVSAAVSAASVTTPVECKYSISLERINSNLVTNNESRNEPMELSTSSDAIQKQLQLQMQLQQQHHHHHQHLHQHQQHQAKFNPEQISPKKRQSIGGSDNTKMIHPNDELKNGCQERSNEAKDLTGRYSMYDTVGHYQPATSTPTATIDLRSSSSDERSASDSMRHHNTDHQRSIVHSPETFSSKEPIVSNTNLEHDSTISKDNNNKLSKSLASDVEQDVANANAIATDASTDITAADTAVTTTITATISIASPTLTTVDATANTTPVSVASEVTKPQTTENETSSNWLDTDAAKSTTPPTNQSPSKTTNTDEPMVADSREKSPPNETIPIPTSSDTLDATATNSDHCRKMSTDNVDKDSSDGTAVSVIEPIELAKQTTKS